MPRKERMKMEKYISDRVQIVLFDTRTGDGQYDMFIFLDGRLARPILQGVTRECAARIARALLGTREMDKDTQEKQK